MTVCSEICRKVMLLSQVKGVGAVKIKQICARENINVPLENIADILSRYVKSTPEDIYGQLKKAGDFADEELNTAENSGVSIICSADEGYPELLKNSKFDPVVLYVKGNLGNHTMSAAVIGSREVPEKYDIITSRITGCLVEKGFSIVSGLALGCDSFGHRAALAGGGHTVAVLGHGLDTVYPKENAGLADEIVASGGALVSQFPFGCRMASFNFAKRDTVQAGLSKFVVMIASGVPGGSLIASRSVLEDGRHLFVPEPIKESLSNEKVKANTVFAAGDADDICSILKLKKEYYDRSRLHILRSRADYSMFDDFMDINEKKSGDVVTGQQSLF